MPFRRVIWMFWRDVYCSGLTCCSGGLYAIQKGYIDVQEDFMLFRGVICSSGGLYAVQEGCMMKKIMMFLVVTNVVAS